MFRGDRRIEKAKAADIHTDLTGLSGRNSVMLWADKNNLAQALGPSHFVWEDTPFPRHCLLWVEFDSAHGLFLNSEEQKKTAPPRQSKT